MRIRACLLVSFALIASACGGDSDEDVAAPSSVTGIVTEVESSGLNEVSSFTVKSGDTHYEILIDEEVDYGFPLGHIEEHRKTAEPVEVDLEERDGRLYARSIVDAPE